MHLKSLALKGFKSFADKSVLTLEPGVTCVIGPNGTGKSNIPDAVLWVFGEQSAKTLRGSTMEDVIFSGSSARQAVGVAEVDLVLDNSDGRVNLEFSEITLTRRMYRSGESEYLINQSPARLMDVLDILHDAGLGRDAHSIIGQGRIGQILTGRPEERRALIEEAAGVLKHKKRKERALRKLAGLDGSLERAADIATEIDRQLRPLERQASRAAKHSEVIAELRTIDIQLAIDDLRNLQSGWETLAKQEREADADLDLTRLRLTEKEDELNKFHHLLEEKGLFVGDISEQRRRTQSVEERLEGGLALLEEKGKNLVDKLSDLRLKLHHAESRIAGARIQRDELAGKRGETDGQLKALYSQLSEIRKEAEHVRRARIEADQQLAALTSSIRTNQLKVSEAQDSVRRAESGAESLVVQRELLVSRQTSVREEAESIRESLATRRQRRDSLEADLTGLRKEVALAESDVDRRVRVVEDRRKTLTSARDELTSAAAESKALEDIDRAFESASPALARVVSRSQTIEGFLGPVADLVQVDDELEPLVEKLMGADLFGVFVEDSQAALAVAHEVAKVEFGEISIVPVDRKVDRGAKPTVGTALIDHIKCDERYRRGVESLFGDVYIVDTIQTAVAASSAHPGFRFATREGAIAWPSGKLTLGTQHRDAEGVLARKRRLNELSDAHEGLLSAVANAEAEVALAEEALAAAQQDSLELNQRHAGIAAERDAVANDIGRIEEQLDRITREQTAVDQRLAAVESESSQLQPAIQELRATVVELGALVEAQQKQYDELTVERDTKFRQESAVTERLGTCQVEIASVSEREIYAKRQYNQLSAEVRQLEETIEASQVAERGLEILRGRLQPLHECYSALREKAGEWAAMLADRAQLEQSDSASLHQTIQEAQDAVRAVTAAVSDKHEALATLRVKKGQLEVEVNQAVRRIVEELSTPLEVALQMEPIENRIEVEDRGHALRKRLAQLGTVNPIAEEEYQSLLARRDYMQAQIDDLKAARTAINKVVAVIDRKIRERFLDTLEQVDARFQEVFGMLFPGGTAQIVLDDPDNPEESGIDFVVQPKGKRVKKMSLLSGGESALSAIAVMFAVNAVRPCPFFILDEVEAALDDSNLRRFVAFIDKMRHHTQFLVITHQRRTMEMADVLYGVSMQSDGVSKVVSQRLDRSKANRDEVINQLAAGVGA